MVTALKEAGCETWDQFQGLEFEDVTMPDAKPDKKIWLRMAIKKRNGFKGQQSIADTRPDALLEWRRSGGGHQLQDRGRWIYQAHI